MKIILVQVGKTNHPYIEKEIAEFKKRLSKYIPFEIITLPEAKNKKKSIDEQKKEEANHILKELKPSDAVLILDEKGKEFTSPDFAKFIQKKMNQAPKRIVFVIGGAFGYHELVYKAHKEKIAISKMTFTHQMVRLFITEQIYRAFSILNNSPYHHI